MSDADYKQQKRAMLRSQIESIWDFRKVLIKCPCGRFISIIVARKCHYCGIWFCPACAQDHFGPNGATDHEAKEQAATWVLPLAEERS